MARPASHLTPTTTSSANVLQASKAKSAREVSFKQKGNCQWLCCVLITYGYYQCANHCSCRNAAILLRDISRSALSGIFLVRNSDLGNVCRHLNRNYTVVTNWKAKKVIAGGRWPPLVRDFSTVYLATPKIYTQRLSKQNLLIGSVIIR